MRRGRWLDLLHWVLFADPAPRRFGQSFSRGLAPLVIAAVLNVGCQQAGLYDRFEWADLDRLHRSAPPEEAAQLALVVVTDQDYLEFFDRKSPLMPVTLVTLVKAVCDQRPVVVGIDLLTADWTADDVRLLRQTVPASCQLVWVPDVYASLAQAGGSEGPPPVELGVTLGSEHGSSAPCTALPVIQPDLDGVIRRYRTHYPVTTADDSAPRLFPTLPWMLAQMDATQRGCEELARQAPPTKEPKRIVFSGLDAFAQIPAGQFLRSIAPDQQALREALGILITGRIVIVGGAYREARDQHRTPLGLRYGSEVLASAVLTEQIGELAEVSWTRSLAMSIALGVGLLALVTWLRFRWPWAVMAASVFSVAASLVACWILFNHLRYFLGVFGAFAGVVIGVVTDVSWEPLAEQWRAWKGEFRAKIQAGGGPECD